MKIETLEKLSSLAWRVNKIKSKQKCQKANIKFISRKRLR